MVDAATLQEVLRRCPPRSAEVLVRVAFEGWTVGELARRFGVDEVAAAVLLFRCARDFRFAADGRPVPAPPLPDAEEAPLARALARAVAAPATAPNEVRAHAEDLAALAAHRDELLRRLEAAEAEAARSPARARERWLRRLAIALILALSAWFWWRERSAPPARPAIPRANLPH